MHNPASFHKLCPKGTPDLNPVVNWGSQRKIFTDKSSQIRKARVNTSMAVKLGNHCVYNIGYHIVFCPKRRKAVLVDAIASDCKSIIQDVAAENKLKVESLEVMHDHVHVFLTANPKISPYLIVKKLKRRLAHVLREKYPQLLRLPCLWSSSYYIGTVGQVSESVVKMYIAGQKGL